MEQFISENREKGFGTNLEEIMLHYEKESFRDRLAEIAGESESDRANEGGIL